MLAGVSDSRPVVPFPFNSPAVTLGNKLHFPTLPPPRFTSDEVGIHTSTMGALAHKATIPRGPLARPVHVDGKIAG